MLLQCQIGSLKYLACLVGDQVIADIVFIFEIKIKRSFGNTCIFYNICNGSFIESIVYKKRESGIQQGSAPFLSLLFPYYKEISTKKSNENWSFFYFRKVA